MPERSSVFEVVQISPETTPGTAVAATKRLQSLSIMPSIKTKITPFQAQGFKYNTTLSVDKEWTEAAVTGLADFANIVYPLSGLYGAAGITTPTGGTLSREWLWNPSSTAPETPITFTVETGSSVRASQFAYGLFTEFGLAFDREGGIKATGAMMGQRLTDGFTLTAPPSDQQTITVTGTPTGGMFTLTFNGATTAGITYAATAANVVTALVALPTIGAGGVTATGGPLPGTPVVVTFAGVLAGAAQPLMTISTTGLTGGTPAGTVAHTVTGGMDLTANPVFPTQVNGYLDTSAANLGTTKLTRFISGEWKVANRWGPLWVFNTSNASWVAHVETDPKVTLKLTVEADAAGMALLTDMRLGTIKFLRFEGVGTVIESALPYLLRNDFAVKVTNVETMKDHNGVYAVTWDFESFHDAVWGKAQSFLIRNTALTL